MQRSSHHRASFYGKRVVAHLDAPSMSARRKPEGLPHLLPLVGSGEVDVGPLFYYVEAVKPVSVLHNMMSSRNQLKIHLEAA